MTKEELEQKVELACDNYKTAMSELNEQYLTIIKNHLADIGQFSYKIGYNNSIVACLTFGDEPLNDRFEFDFTFDSRYVNVPSDDCFSNYKFVMNLMVGYHNHGDLSLSDKKAREYYIAFGKIAEKIEVMEKEFFSVDRSKVDIANKSMYDAKNELSDFKTHENENHRKMILDKFNKKLCVGAKLELYVPDYSKEYPCKERKPSGRFKTIEHITDKYIVFKENYGHRTKKTEVLYSLEIGEYKWCD